MNLRLIYKFLFFFGVIFWLGGLLGDTNGIQYLRHGVIFGPIFSIIASLIWLKMRWGQPILIKFQPKKYLSKFDAIMAFIFDNIFRELFGLLFIMMMVFHLFIINYISNSAHYSQIKDYVSSDQKLETLIGDINGMSYYIYKSDLSDRNRSIYIYGTKGKIKVEVFFYSDRPKAQVSKLEYH